MVLLTLCRLEAPEPPPDTKGLALEGGKPFISSRTSILSFLFLDLWLCIDDSKVIDVDTYCVAIPDRKVQ
jgi:hypothetical protein